ncbi:type I methionyl aminopeptidase [Aeromicrobium wangtongii]|uniref:Methionine aminopeptidase n=1 Tax=Aeromicrobium wangtongii TaxID=2969247 RepID=A0ABY5M4Q3_9ACTN|nr:type I methionyl aminopeptidase [Aeromicrobium wangtongii]MCD9198805.1 type I methionyl aminopeptidase [Aeromicrobium wangtongii]UUP13155.1 type I methionyl aminopeptidase [Aeromicrobium wangtongii]
MFDRGIQIKTPEQIATMRSAGLVVGRTLELLTAEVRAGMTTSDLDTIARDAIASAGATSNFLGYHGFPGVICTSVNDEVVHGIPGDRVLRDGDIVSIDCGAVVDGWHGDAAVTVAIGEVPDEVTALLRATEDAMWRGIAAATIGGRVGDISHAVETAIVSAGDYGIVEGYTGHGIGTEMHQAPDVPNYGKPRRGPKLVKGLALAVEPMVTLGTHQTRTLADDWTVVTTDGSWAAHFENTFTLTDTGAWVLTALDGGRERLAALGVPYGGD